MKYLDEYRDPKLAKLLLEKIRAITTKPWTIMEICGGQTHAIIRNGIDQVLPDNITLVHGPGCPVCVTPLEVIDQAIVIAAKPGVIFTSFGDMLRVPGSREDLLSVRSRGGDVRIVYSPLEAVKLAQENPKREVVFFSIGFETTAPGNAMAIAVAKQQGLTNFSVLVCQVLVPPAVEAILSDRENTVQGLIAAGHVNTVMGWHEYEPLATKYHCPIVPTGFEPVDLLEGIGMLIGLLENQDFRLCNQYRRSVRAEGNTQAQAIMKQVFAVCDQKWRGLGVIPKSGLCLNEAHTSFDAAQRFGVTEIVTEESALCQMGLVLKGKIKPCECPAFGRECDPQKPLGAPMVSAEGACAAYYRFRRQGD